MKFTDITKSSVVWERKYTCTCELCHDVQILFIFKTEASSAMSSGTANVSSVVSMAIKTVSVGGDIGLQGHTAWLLGRLYLSSCSLTENKSAGKTKYIFKQLPCTHL